MSTELGYLSQNPSLALLTSFSGGKKLLFPIATISREAVLFLKYLVEKGHFKPLIDRHYPPEQVAEAYRFVETGMKTGNVVITIDKMG